MTKIRQTSPNEVTLTYEDIFGQTVTREFYVPHNGGYVRERRGDRQVCVGLSTMGGTLKAEPETLLAVIRKEWRAHKRAIETFRWSPK